MMVGKKLITLPVFLRVLLFLISGNIFGEVNDYLISSREAIYPYDYRIGALHPFDRLESSVDRAAEMVKQFFTDLKAAGMEISSPVELEGEIFRTYFTEQSFYMQEKMASLIEEERNIFPQYARIGRGIEEERSGEKVLIRFPVKLAAFYRGKLYVRTGTVLLEDEKISGADFSLFAPFPQGSAVPIVFEADTTDRSYHGQYTW
jgi:hypothetical protein